MRHLILTTGTSITRGLERAQLAASPGHERAQLSAKRLLEVGLAAVATMSAELSALALLEATRDDRVTVITTHHDRLASRRSCCHSSSADR